MVRVLIFVAMLAVTIYAVADWNRTPAEEMPGKIAKPIWLIIILMTTTFASIGALAWLILRWVGRAEARQRPASPTPSAPRGPDDDPEFLFRLERDIQRKRKEQEQGEDPEDN